jgi:hypothetical protein
VALHTTQANAVLEVIAGSGLDPADYDWSQGQLYGLPPLPGQQAVLIHRHSDAEFQFAYDKRGWKAYYRPGNDKPEDQVRPGLWPGMLQAVSEWAQVIKRERDAPDLWAELAQQQEALSRPSRGENTPFSADEMDVLRREFDALKAYVRTLELQAGDQAEVIARLDYLVEKAAAGTPRIDWWDQLVGAVVGLWIASTVQPGTVQSILAMAAHGLAALFGAPPPTALPPG